MPTTPPAILEFPPREAHCQTFATRVATVTTEAWADHHLPVLGVVIPLLELDDAAFADRFASMRDREGLALVHELVDAIDDATEGVQLTFQALALVQARIGRGLKAAGLAVPR